jgi:hypothetical protein
VVSQKTAASWIGRLPVSPPVLWTGIAVGVFLAVEAMVHSAVLPLALGVIADAAFTFLLIVAAAVVLAELTRRHHRTVLRHGGRLSAAGVRRVRRHGSGALAWLAVRAGSWWASREHRPLMFRRIRSKPEDPAAETPPGTAAPQRVTSAGVTYTICPKCEYAYAGSECPACQEEAAAPAGTSTPADDPDGGITSMTVSKISTGHRAQRAARTGAPGIPSEWAAVVGQTADFEPESDAELLDWMGRQVTGLSAWAEALVDTYEHTTNVIGVDPKVSAMLHDVADAAAQAAETMAAAKARFTEHYELPREFAANGGLMTHDGRWVTGEGA